MSYIGTKPTSSFGTATSQTFTGNNSLTEFTLNRRVSAPEDLEVFVSNVQQQPTESYTIGSNGLTLTFSEAPPSGQFYVVYRTEVTQSALDPSGARTSQANTFTENQTFSGNVDINKLLTVDQDTASQMVSSFEGLNGRVHIGRYGHILQQNTNDSTTNFWTTATRNSGNFEIGYGTSTTDGVVSSSIIIITTSGATSISGDLTVDTSTLKVDAANNRVGIGTTSPDAKLDVEGTTDAEIRITRTTASVSGASSDQGAVLHLFNDIEFENGYDGNAAVGQILFSSDDGSTGQGIRAKIACNKGSYSHSESLDFYVSPGNTTSGQASATSNSNGKRMTIDYQGNVGIGASPESAVKLEVNAGSDGAVAISGRSDGGNGNNRRFNIIPFASGGTYGGGFRLQTRNSSNVFHTAIEYINSQQEVFHGNYRTADVPNQFSSAKHWYTGTESGNFSNAGSGVANAQTMTTNLAYQGIQIVCVKVYYNSDSALMHETFATICNQYHNSGVATQHSHNGTGIIDSVSLSLTGGYNTRRLVVTLDPATGYTGNNYTYAVYYGYTLN